MKIKIDKLDTLFSKFIRLRVGGKCEYCGKPKDLKQLQCSHFHGRRKRSVRYDPDNACGVCFTCHQYLASNPYAHTEFFKKRLGDERFQELNIRAEMLVKIDKAEMEQILEEKIKLLEGK